MNIRHSDIKKTLVQFMNKWNSMKCWKIAHLTTHNWHWSMQWMSTLKRMKEKIPPRLFNTFLLQQKSRILFLSIKVVFTSWKVSFWPLLKVSLKRRFCWFIYSFSSEIFWINENFSIEINSHNDKIRSSSLQNWWIFYWVCWPVTMNLLRNCSLNLFRHRTDSIVSLLMDFTTKINLRLRALWTVHLED